MSHNSQTRLEYIFEEGTIGTDAVLQFSTTKELIYDAIFGVNEDSASATSGNWVGNSGVTAANKQGVKITSDKEFSVASKSIDKQHIPLDLSDYYVAGTDGDVVWVAYLKETSQEL